MGEVPEKITSWESVRLSVLIAVTLVAVTYSKMWKLNKIDFETGIADITGAAADINMMVRVLRLDWLVHSNLERTSSECI